MAKKEPKPEEGGTYRVFDSRMNLVAQVSTPEEALKLSEDFGGTYLKVTE